MVKIQNIVLSQNTFFVDRTIFTNYFPELKAEKLRIYLLMCRVVGAKNGSFFMSLKTITQEVNLSEYHVRNALDFLSKNFFIKKVGNRFQANEYVVLTVPDYHETTNTYYSNEKISRDRFNAKDNLNGYCELPIEVMQGSILRDKTKWTDRKIKILGQLYMNHWIDVYGGVDPEVIHGKNNSLYVSEFVSQMVGCTPKDVAKTVKWLINEGYVYKVKTIYRPNQNSCYKEMQFIGDAKLVITQPNDISITAIRLTCMPDLKLSRALARTGGKIAI
ncbi:hypothetical protein ACIQ4I_15735 [Rummeliibacillus sp. NPDC094406]|uniref:hypothetical protein n=1 Tax=Rummeliibacillus sp. NPDC094406 TaxID=3364511 RepID=UPI0037FDC4E0